MDDHNAAVDYVERLDLLDWLDELAIHNGDVVAWAEQESELLGDLPAGSLVRGAVARLRNLADVAERAIEQLSGNSGQLKRPMLPCPFCGHFPRYEVFRRDIGCGDFRTVHRYRCDNPECHVTPCASEWGQSGYGHGDTRTDAEAQAMVRETWNRRPPPIR